MQMLWTKVNACGRVETILIHLMLHLHFIHPHQLFPCGELQGKVQILFPPVVSESHIKGLDILLFSVVIQLYHCSTSLQPLCLSSTASTYDFTFACARSNCLCSCAGNFGVNVVWITKLLLFCNLEYSISCCHTDPCHLVGAHEKIWGQQLGGEFLEFGLMIKLRFFIFWCPIEHDKNI